MIRTHGGRPHCCHSMALLGCCCCCCPASLLVATGTLCCLPCFSLCSCCNIEKRIINFSFKYSKKKHRDELEVHYHSGSLFCAHCLPIVILCPYSWYASVFCFKGY